MYYTCVVKFEYEIKSHYVVGATLSCRGPIAISFIADLTDAFRLVQLLFAPQNPVDVGSEEGHVHDEPADGKLAGPVDPVLLGAAAQAGQTAAGQEEDAEDHGQQHQDGDGQDQEERDQRQAEQDDDVDGGDLPADPDDVSPPPAAFSQ